MNTRQTSVIAQKYAYNFVSLVWDELPQTHQDHAIHETGRLARYLDEFAWLVKEQQLTGFAVRDLAGQFAQSRYFHHYAGVHHDRVHWAFFRFRLEVALLSVAQADAYTIYECYSYHSVLGQLAHNLTVHLN